jgi:hypothetical protein
VAPTVLTVSEPEPEIIVPGKLSFAKAAEKVEKNNSNEKTRK